MGLYMKIKILDLAGFEPAIKAMRLSMKSGYKSDSSYGCMRQVSPHMYEPVCGKCAEQGHCPHEETPEEWEDESYYFHIGKKDHELSMKLCQAGSDYRKHIRLIDVWAEIQAPLYWWKQFDTYRMGIDKVSESTMDTLTKKPIVIADFESTPELNNLLLDVDNADDSTTSLLDDLNNLREGGDFETLNALLSQSYLQTSICKINYEAIRNMYHARKKHKLKEWQQFCDWIETLPYSEFITGEVKLMTDYVPEQGTDNQD